MNKPITIFQPGKLFLAGEYAATKSPNPSIILSLKLGLTLTIEESNAGYCTISSNSSHLNFSFDDLNEDLTVFDSYWHFALGSIVLIKQLLCAQNKQNIRNFNIKISSDMTDENHNKLGLGSSAAITSGIISLFDQFYDLHLSKIEKFKLAAISHYFIQQKGSLGDVASSIYHGVILYSAPDNTFLKETIKLNYKLAFINWPNLTISYLNWPKNWQISILPTFCSASTSKHLSKQHLTNDFYLKSNLLVKQIADAINLADFHLTKKLIQANQTLLIESLNTGYATDKLLTRISYFKTNTDAICKISGAGYGDNAILITTNTANDLTHPFLAIKATLMQPEDL